MKLISTKTHGYIDYLTALALFADESANVWLPHLVVGAGYFVVSLMTQTKTSRESAVAM